MAELEGFKELSNQLSKLGTRVGGRAFRSAALSATLPALRAAQAAAPVGTPPFESGKDPYPVRSYRGTLRTPGFLKRNIRRKTLISPDKRFVRVMIGPAPEAFYGTQFVELGTSRQPKRPWLEPAFRASQGLVIAKMRVRLKALIDKARR